MNPDMEMQEIIDYLDQQMVYYRRGLLSLEQALDKVGESAKLLSVKAIELDRGKEEVTQYIEGCGCPSCRVERFRVSE